MIDQALGLQPAVRRRNHDSTSEKSSPKPQLTKPNPPPYQNNRISRQNKYSEEKTQQPVENRPISNQEFRPKINTGKLQSKISMEQASSPAIQDRHLRRLSKPHDGQNEVMKNSAKHYTHQSVKVVEDKAGEVKKDEEGMYKIKMIVFLVISFLMMYWAMVPTRKCPYKKNKH